MRFFVLLVFAFLAVGCDSVGLDVPPEPEPGVGWDAMLDAINAVRAEGATCGATRYDAAPPLIWDSRLEGAAARHSRDMASNDHFDHRGSDGSDTGDRAIREGYRWRVIGENIARYQQTVDEVMEDWLESPGHCRQILDPTFSEVGVAEEGGYWTQVFGVPR